MGVHNYKRTVSRIKLWDEVASEFFSKNQSSFGAIRTSDYYSDLRGTYSGADKVAYYYSLDGYPSEFNYAYRQILRMCCKGETTVSFINYLDRHKILWNSNKLRSRFNTWKILDDQLGERNINEYNYYGNANLLRSSDWKRQSLVYLSDAELKRQRKMFALRSLMIVTGERGEDFDDSIKELLYNLSNLSIKYKRIMFNIQDYLRVFSPFSLCYNSKIRRSVGCSVFTDELLGRFVSYNQGTVGYKGIYFGVDIYSCYPVIKPIKPRFTSAENILITGETGSGKGFFMKPIIIQLMANPRVIVTIQDIEGFEYEDFLYLFGEGCNSVQVNLAEGSGKYYDPVPIFCGLGSDKSAFSLSVSYTTCFIKAMVGRDLMSNYSWLSVVISDAVYLTYSNAGVTRDFDTWSKSGVLRLSSIYDTMKTMLTDVDTQNALNTAYNSFDLYTERQELVEQGSKNDVTRLLMSNKDYQYALTLAISRLQHFFEDGGNMSHIFQERLSIEEIITADLVINSFGLAGKTESEIDPVVMAIMQLGASNISHLRSLYANSKGYFNLKIWDEFQRWIDLPDSDKTIKTDITGGRKLGDINIIATNVIKDLLDRDSFGVLQNVTSCCIGVIPDAGVRAELCNRLSLPQMIPELEMIVSNSGSKSDYEKPVESDTDMDNPYDKAFLVCLDKVKFAITKMYVPDDLEKSRLFQTGTGS